MFLALRYTRSALCVCGGIGGDPGATGIHNRPAGPSLRPRAGVYVSQQAVLHRNTGSMRAERVSLTASDSQSRERAVR